jgi:molybdopterin converting factor small subunit
MPNVTVRYFAGAKRAATVGGDEVECPAGASVDAVLATVAARRGQALATVLPACSFLMDGVTVRDTTAPICSDAQLDVLPPFAGG